MTDAVAAKPLRKTFTDMTGPERVRHVGKIFVLWTFGLAAVILLLALIGIFAPRTTTAPAIAPPPAVPSLAKVDSAIKVVKVDGDSLMVRANLSEGLDDGFQTNQAASIVQEIGQALQKGVSENTDGVKTVSIEFVGPGIDRLGNPVPLPLFIAGFPLADLKAAHFENLGFANTMDLASGAMALSQPGAHEIAAWCLKNPEDGAAFCKTISR